MDSNNLKEVTVDHSTGAIAFASGNTSGSFTLVLSKFETQDAGTAVNDDLLAAPVAINVIVVD